MNSVTLHAKDSRIISISWRALLVLVAALSATYLSGIEFPGQNNLWHLPVVLDFADSIEGPHDPYHASFGKFVSFFWLIVRFFTDENNVATVFVSLQLIGNILLALSLYAVARLVSRAPAITAFSISYLCFCFGLWGLTRLGQSEIFVTYATHTQFALIGCLLGLLLLLRDRPYLAAIALGTAANINLFIAGWTSLGALLYLAHQTRCDVKRLSLFSLIFLGFALPVLIWIAKVIHQSPPSTISINFYSDFLAGHVFGLRYPQALAQTLLLSLAAGYALRLKSEAADASAKLSVVVFASCATLVVAAITPYLLPIPLVLNLHPLRYASVVVLLAAIAAAASVGCNWPTERRAGSIIALLGFMLKLPVVSIFAFAILIPRPRSRAKYVGFWIFALAAFSMIFPGYLAFSQKSMLAAAIVSILSAFSLAFGAQVRPATHLLQIFTVWVLAFATISSNVGIALSLAIILCLIPCHQIVTNTVRTFHTYLSIAGLTLAISLVIGTNWSMPTQQRFVLGSLTIVAIVGVGSAFLRKFSHQKLSGYCAMSIIAGLILIGAANGVRDHFGVHNSSLLEDNLDAQRWARANTPIDTLFYAKDISGFSTFSRRPVWWDASQMAASLWAPDLYNYLQGRNEQASSIKTAAELISLVKKNHVHYIVLKTSDSFYKDFVNFSIEFQNSNFIIIKVDKIS